MPTNPKFTAAFRAMKALGIAEDKVKPVLKSLLKLYDNKWELIEEDNYRALIDAISDQEEALLTEQNKRHENADVPNSLAFIKPKDEPFTDDTALFEVPLPAVHPDEPSAQPATAAETLEVPHAELQGRERQPLGRRNPPWVNLSGPRPAAAAETEAPPPVATPTPAVTEPSPQPQRKRPRQEECADPQVEQETGTGVDPSGGRGDAGGVRVETDPKMFAPLYTCGDGYVIKQMDSLRANPSIAAGLLQGVCLPKDMAALDKDAVVCLNEACYHIALAAQCMVSAHGRISKLSDDLAQSKDEVKDARQKLAEERKWREEAEESAKAFSARLDEEEESAKAFSARLAEVKAELQQAKELAVKVPALEAEMEKMLKRHERELRAAENKGYDDGFARAGQEFIAQCRRMCNETGSK